MDALLEQAVAEQDLTKRAQLSTQANEAILKDAAVVPIMNRIAAMVFQPWVLRPAGANPIYPYVNFNEMWLAADHR